MDFDNDGWLDLYVANGAVELIYEQKDKGEAHPLKMPDQLFRGMGAGRFEDVSALAGPIFGRQEVGRGTAHGDLDNDGDPDMVVVNNGGKPWVLENRVGQNRPWLGLRLAGTEGKRDMLGALVGLELPDGTLRWRRVHSDGSYLSSSDPRVLFGLGASDRSRDASPDEEGGRSMTVRWPDGSVERWEGLEPGRYHTLVQGEGGPAGH